MENKNINADINNILSGLEGIVGFAKKKSEEMMKNFPNEKARDLNEELNKAIKSVRDIKSDFMDLDKK